MAQGFVVDEDFELALAMSFSHFNMGQGDDDALAEALRMSVADQASQDKPLGHGAMAAPLPDDEDRTMTAPRQDEMSADIELELVLAMSVSQDKSLASGAEAADFSDLERQSALELAMAISASQADPDFLEAKRRSIDDQVDRFKKASVRNLMGNTALHLAVLAKSDDAVQALLDEGMNVNATNHSGQTPLHCAAHSNSVQMVRILVQHCADLHAKASTELEGVSQTAFQLAEANSHMDVARELRHAAQSCRC